MSASAQDSLALARKLRPQRFADLVGQDLTARILRQAVKRQRTTHAYLFCGSRGTGKTSTARILTRAPHCLDLQDRSPEPSPQAARRDPDETPR